MEELPNPTTRSMRSPAPRSLKGYERDVLRLMVCGKTPHDIAAGLQRSVRAVCHIQETLREKLGLTTNEQVIVAAIRERLVPLDIEPES